LINYFPDSLLHPACPLKLIINGIHLNTNKKQNKRKCQYPQQQNIIFDIPNSKFQIPNSKFQIPNSKFQIPNSKFQIPCSNENAQLVELIHKRDSE
jgi:hypothetical protein